jgi:SAM-dependent methyltransferase
MTTREIYNPDDDMLGGYTSTDGTVEFYNRVNAILKPELTVLDLGAGRGSWSFLDKCKYRNKLQTIKGKVKEYICADIDEAVLSNSTSDRNVIIQDNRVPLEDKSVDIILADNVLEHIVDVRAFISEVSRLLKPGGYFCARTPHQLHYVSLVARFIRNRKHAGFLRRIQPTRQSEDVFPTSYRFNTMRKVRSLFPGWSNYSYIHVSEPRYYFGSLTVYRILTLVHALSPRVFVGNLFVFLKKHGSD